MPAEEAISGTSRSFMNWIVDQFQPGILLLWSVWGMLTQVLSLSLSHTVSLFFIVIVIVIVISTKPEIPFSLSLSHD
jgi:hypothetical protein